MAILARHDAVRQVEEIAAGFGAERGFEPLLFQGSSPGAVEVGVRHLAQLPG